MNLVGVCTIEPAHDDAPRDSLRHRSQVAVCVGEYAARRRAMRTLLPRGWFVRLLDWTVPQCGRGASTHPGGFPG